MQNPHQDDSGIWTGMAPETMINGKKLEAYECTLNSSLLLEQWAYMQRNYFWPELQLQSSNVKSPAAQQGSRACLQTDTGKDDDPFLQGVGVL